MPGLRGPEDCLEFALANGEKFGIWGGLRERERRRMRRARALAPTLRRRGLAAVGSGAGGSPALGRSGDSTAGPRSCVGEIRARPDARGTASRTAAGTRPTSSAGQIGPAAAIGAGVVHLGRAEDERVDEVAGDLG